MYIIDLWLTFALANKMVCIEVKCWSQTDRACSSILPVVLIDFTCTVGQTFSWDLIYWSMPYTQNVFPSLSWGLLPTFWTFWTFGIWLGSQSGEYCNLFCMFFFFSNLPSPHNVLRLHSEALDNNITAKLHRCVWVCVLQSTPCNVALGPCLNVEQATSV